MASQGIAMYEAKRPRRETREPTIKQLVFKIKELVSSVNELYIATNQWLVTIGNDVRVLHREVEALILHIAEMRNPVPETLISCFHMSGGTSPWGCLFTSELPLNLTDSEV
ncbi:hypothetical protein QVD17_28491 [Tagetes erecta]|uniref:Uncharacterized protein n=1 Tax=Tagetes erecta TaxID=13708 RepID=A0AAD8NSS9_TARER|nr:hypothetical protein QVD17_28491 [Tagetes erecta]